VKRVENIVEIHARILKKMPVRLVMVGDGPERMRAEQRAHALGVADSVVFLGKHMAVEELLGCADLFLLPSQSESFGLSALEAMSCGTPVVASNVGGIPEVVEDGECGLLFPPGEVEAMAEGAIEILSDPVRWHAMSHASRRIAEERFSAAAVVSAYESYYERVLSESQSGGEDAAHRASSGGSGRIGEGR
jgi:N-acetyl-alpha-D-glucosaminyl L-malate synthase BshA